MCYILHSCSIWCLSRNQNCLLIKWCPILKESITLDFKLVFPDSARGKFICGPFYCLLLSCQLFFFSVALICSKPHRITINCVNHNKLWKILKEMGIPDHLTCLLRKVRNQQLELDMEQQTDSKWEKEYVKAIYCHPAYLTYMQSTSWETLGWKKHKLESRLPGEISITSDMQMIPPLWQRTKEPLDESQRGEWKSWLKAQHSEN